jgi:hypothetical protein
MRVYNPSYLGSRGRRIMVQGQLGQKWKTLSEEKKLTAKELGEWLNGRVLA